MSFTGANNCICYIRIIFLLLFFATANLGNPLVYPVYSLLGFIPYFSICIFFFFLYTQDRTLMLEITHTCTPQTTTYAIWMEQPLMMVLTLNCKYYKNIIVQQRKSMRSQYQYLKLMHNYKLSASNAHLLSNSCVLL